MNKEKMYDITEVCHLLGTTARTLRFYEQKGLIESVRLSDTKRRFYTSGQVELIQKILILRKLGLSVKAIYDLQKNDTDLRTALLEKRAEIGAMIESRLKEAAFLNHALVMISEKRDIFTEASPSEPDGSKFDAIVEKCGLAIVSGDHETLYSYLSGTMKEYMPQSAYEKIRADTLEPLGRFIAVEKLEYDNRYENMVYQYIRYEKLGLKIRYVFIGSEIHGLWMGYYEI